MLKEFKINVTKLFQLGKGIHKTAIANLSNVTGSFEMYNYFHAQTPQTHINNYLQV